MLKTDVGYEELLKELKYNTDYCIFSFVVKSLTRINIHIVACIFSVAFP